MKIICDNCRTKYSIADEKVQGKVFKIRCKKCQNIIVVRGTQADDAAVPSQEMEAVGEGPVGGGAPDSGEAPVWHVVIGREQVGPMTPAEVQVRFSQGEITAETYIWREGFSDWMRISAVSEFTHLAPPAEAAAQEWSAPPAAAAPASWEAPAHQAAAAAWNPGGEETARADSAGLFAPNSTDPGKDLFASHVGQETGEGDPIAPAAGARQRGPSDLFQPAPAQRAGGAELFSSSAGSNGGQQLFPSEEEPKAGQVQMTGARHENSVLFSLTNLQALAMGGKPAAASVGPTPGGGTDGSGLIDIRSMAAAPARAANPMGDDLPDLGGFSAPMAAAPVLLPAITDEKPRWLLPVIIATGSVLVIAIVVLTVVLLLRKPEPQVVAMVPPTAPVTAPGGSVEEKAAGAAEKKAVSEEKSEEKAEAKEEKKEESKVAGRRKTTGGRGKGKSKKGTQVAAAAKEVDDPPAASGSRGGGSSRKGKGDELDALIDGAIGGGKPRAAKPKAAAAAADSNLPDSLSKEQIQGGMRSVRGGVQGCFDKFRVPGNANVSITIGKSGSISAARVKGMFAGTPTGACIERAVRGARFPRFKGSPMSFDYPFILR